jgi:tRNA(fMet)-specific endonuclease VapC
MGIVVCGGMVDVVAEAITLLERLHEKIGMNIITFAEVYEGIYSGSSPTQHERVFRELLRFVPLYGITRPIAKTYARVRGELAQEGLLIDQPDRFIAATAIEHILLLVTRNRKDFGRIPDLKLYQ